MSPDENAIKLDNDLLSAFLVQSHVSLGDLMDSIIFVGLSLDARERVGLADRPSQVD